MQKASLQRLFAAKAKSCRLPSWFFLASIILGAGAENANSQIRIGRADFAVYIFLSEDCPISQSYTLVLKELHQNYAKAGFDFIGIFPNASSTQESMLSFQRNFALPFPVKLDNANKISRSLGARLTPEVFVVDKASNKVLYQGRIDNAFFKLGQRRSVITTHELQEALEALKRKQPIAIAKTEAVGCFITPRK